MDSKIHPRPDTPRPDIMTELRTPRSYHGVLWYPSDPRKCDIPGGPCDFCQDRIDTLVAAESLVLLSQSCCGVRPAFMEPCPECNAVGSLVTHAEKGIRCCNGCEERLCVECFAGARYFCPLRRLSPPGSPLARQEALGVQSPEAEEKGENK